MVLASANPEKVAELRAILGDAIHLVARPPDVPEVVEDAATFVGNARLKAAALVAVTGLAALADDSGLEVDALDGAPGVRSARYAGDSATDADNVAELLAALADHPDPADRRARFRCVVVLQRTDGTELVADGTAEGHIARSPRGAAGFGYDPVFVPDRPARRAGDVAVDDRTFAELAPAEKHAVSHRGRALAVLVAKLADAAVSTIGRP